MLEPPLLCSACKSYEMAASMAILYILLFIRQINSLLLRCQMKNPAIKSAVPCLVILRPLCKIFLAAPGLTHNFWWATRVRFFLSIFWLRIVHFGLVWLWYMTRQFRIHLNFLQNVCVHSRLLARSAAHPQLWVLWGLKRGTENQWHIRKFFKICDFDNNN